MCQELFLTETAALAHVVLPAASAMEKVADHYGIPTIHFGLEVSRLSQDGKLLWKSPLPKTPEDPDILNVVRTWQFLPGGGLIDE